MRAKAGATADRRGAGHQHRHCRADRASWSRKGSRRCWPAIQLELRPAADFRRRGGSKTDRADPLSGPGGFARWSLRLLEEKVVELHIVERASDNTIGRTLKKTFSSRIASSNGCPPDANAAFVATMEDVLEVYQRPHDPQRPLVCLDEPRAADHRHARADPRQTWTTSASRLRYDAMASPICSWCSRRWKAGGMSRSPTATPPSIMPTAQGFVRYAFSRCGENRAGAG